MEGKGGAASPCPAAALELNDGCGAVVLEKGPWGGGKRWGGTSLSVHLPYTHPQHPHVLWAAQSKSEWRRFKGQT